MRIIIYVVASIVLCTVIGCHRPSAVDSERLELLRSKYGEKFEFELVPEFYLYAVSRRELPVAKNEMIRIYKTFFFVESSNNLRGTRYVYLNVYDSKKKFEYQVAYSSSKNKFVFSESEHY